MGVAHLPIPASDARFCLPGFYCDQNIQRYLYRYLEDICYADAHLQSTERGAKGNESLVIVG